MIFLNLFCCREKAPGASISLGEIVNQPDTENMALEVYVQISNGTIRSNTDFLYLQPQIEIRQNDLYANQFYGGLLNQQKLRQLSKKVTDSESLPKRLKDLNKERVILIEKNSSLCENVGNAFIDLSVEKGLYKLYFVRIENEQRVMANSRLEILGSSESFSIKRQVNENNPLHCSDLEESKSRFDDSSQCENSNSIDSRILLQQLKQCHIGSANSQTYSVLGYSDQTRLQYQTSRDDCTNTLGSPHSFEYMGKVGSQNYQSLQESTISQNSQTTYVVKKENNEALIMTQRQVQSAQNQQVKPPSFSQQSQSASAAPRHRRNQNFSQVLEEISQTKLKQKKKTVQKCKTAREGKENQLDLANSKKQEYFQDNNISGSQTKAQRNTTISSAHQKSITNENSNDEDLNVQYVKDAESIAAPILRYNPQTRTYFKISIYSPSNRLDTVQEEQNSTISEVTGVEQFSSSNLNSGIRHSCSRSKINHHPLKKSSGLNLIDEFKETDMVIEEKLNENDDLSESMEIPSNPVPKNKVYKEKHFKKDGFFTSAQVSTGAHTRENSNYIYSSKTSLVGTKGTCASYPLGNQAKKSLEENSRMITQSYRQSFNGFLPQESVEDYLNGAKTTKKDTLEEDINVYMNPYSGTFICTGGTDLDKGIKEQQIQTPVKSEKSNLSIEKTVIKNTNYNKPESPKAYYDEEKRQVFIIQHNFEENQKIQHCIKWKEDTDPEQIGKAIENVIQQVQQKDINGCSGQKEGF